MYLRSFAGADVTRFTFIRETFEMEGNGSQSKAVESQATRSVYDEGGCFSPPKLGRDIRLFDVYQAVCGTVRNEGHENWVTTGPCLFRGSLLIDFLKDHKGMLEVHWKVMPRKWEVEPWGKAWEKVGGELQGNVEHYHNGVYLDVNELEG